MDEPRDGYSLADQAGDADAILAAVGVASVFVLGSSSGGHVAQQLAVAPSGRVSASVLVGSPLGLQGSPPFVGEVDLLTDPLDKEWVRA